MRFITELELRERFKHEKFQSLRLAPHERLTPGARQFLIDFHIDFSKVEEDEQPVSSSMSTAVQSYPQSLAEFHVRQELYDELYLLAAKLLVHASYQHGLDSFLAAKLQSLASDLKSLELEDSFDELSPVSPHAQHKLKEIDFSYWDLRDVRFQSFALVLELDAYLLHRFHYWQLRLEGLCQEKTREIMLVKLWLQVLCQLREFLILNGLRGCSHA